MLFLLQVSLCVVARVGAPHASDPSRFVPWSPHDIPLLTSLLKSWHSKHMQTTFDVPWSVWGRLPQNFTLQPRGLIRSLHFHHQLCVAWDKPWLLLSLFFSLSSAPPLCWSPSSCARSLINQVTGGMQSRIPQHTKTRVT